MQMGTRVAIRRCFDSHAWLAYPSAPKPPHKTVLGRHPVNGLPTRSRAERTLAGEGLGQVFFLQQFA